MVVNVIVVVLPDIVIAGVIGGILYLGYFAYLESSQGRTFGKQVLKLRVLGATGGNPTMEESLRRNAWAALGSSAVRADRTSAGLLRARRRHRDRGHHQPDPLKRGWHDKFGNTTVTKEG